MRAKLANGVGLEKLLDAGSAAWSAAEVKRITLVGTPLALQPTAIIRNTFKQENIGAVKQAEVAALHTGEHLAFRLSWKDPHADTKIEDNDQFVDAAAIFLPTHAQSPLLTMGAPGQEVNMWYWRGDERSGRHVVAAGIGTTRTIDQKAVRVSAQWHDGRWQVVIARALALTSNEPLVQLQAGHATRFAVAIWEGHHQERAGLKSFTPEYIELQLDPLEKGGS